MKQLLYRLSFVVFLALIFTLSLISTPTQAASFEIACGDTDALIDAIISANANADPDTIELAEDCAYSFSTAHNDNNALPVITSQIVINGNGATLQRDVSGATLRLVWVDTTGDLTLNDMTVRGWNAEGALNNVGSLTIYNSAVVENSVYGIYNDAGTLWVESSQVSRNVRDGIYIDNNATVHIISSTISENTWEGLDIWLGSTVYITSSTISKNRDGINNETNAAVYIASSTISENREDGIHNRGNLEMVSSRIAGNGDDGIDSDYGSVALVFNSIVSGNDSAGIRHNGNTVQVMNSTIASNGYRGIIHFGSPVTVHNSIIWGNEASLEGAGVVTISSSVVENGVVGSVDIITDDPLFVAPVEYTDAPTTAGDYRLQAASPAINAGSNAALPPDELDIDGDGDTAEPLPLDLDGNPRIRSTIVDIGAYEHTVDAGVNYDKVSISVVEGGATDSIAAVLLARPGAPVTLSITTGGQVMVEPEELVFTPENWATPQSITVTAIDDTDIEGPHTDVIQIALSSDHADYDGYGVTVVVTITDNDSEPLAQELLQNGGFEDKISGTNKPEAWKLKAPKSLKVLCKPDKANTGNCALKFRHGTPIRGVVTQDVDLTSQTLLAGDQLVLSVYVRDGKTPARVKTVLKVVYADGTIDKVKKALTSDVGFELSTLPTLTLQDTPTAVRVRFTHKTANAALTIDDASLLLVPSSSPDRRGGGSDLILPPPALPDGFRGTN